MSKNIAEAVKVAPKRQGAAAIIAEPYVWIEPKDIPPRKWILKPSYIRKYMSLTGAPGGKAKSTLVITEVLSLVSGKNLLGTKPDRPMKVWIWNGEDPKDEMQRRIAATAKLYGIKKADIGGRLHVGSGREMEIIIAQEDWRKGTSLVAGVVEKIISEIREKEIDVLIIDPLISVHRVNENDNSAMDLVATAFSRIADEADCSVMLVHHSRKTGGDNAGTDDLRGASAVRDKARDVRTLNTMTVPEAKSAGLSEYERLFYIRVDRGKSNLAPPPEAATWFKLISVDLGNGDKDQDNSDKIGVASAWSYPKMEPLQTSGPDILRCFEAIKEGGPYRKSAQSKAEPWVGIPIARVLMRDANDAQTRRALKRKIDEWFEAGVLKEKMMKGPGRKDRLYVVPGALPATLIASVAL